MASWLKHLILDIAVWVQAWPGTLRCDLGKDTSIFKGHYFLQVYKIVFSV